MKQSKACSINFSSEKKLLKREVINGNNFIYGRMVDFMRLHLFWIDKRWQERGYANNYNLIVDMENKTYKVYVNSFYAYHRAEDIEVKKKSDITEYVEYLKENGFKEVETI